jgi:hypothetical protein
MKFMGDFFMKKVITLVILTAFLISLTSCVVKNDSSASINNKAGNTSETTQTASNENASEVALDDTLVKAFNKTKLLDNCYYVLIAELNGNRSSAVKVWVKGNKSKILRDNSDVFNYIDFEEGKFIDYNNKSKEGNTVPSNQLYLDDFKRYAGAYLANADYESAMNLFNVGGKEDIEGNPCIVGSYEDSTTKSKIYISEQYGMVMRFDFSTDGNKSLFYVTNFTIGSVTDQDVELPQDAKISEN